MIFCGGCKYFKQHKNPNQRFAGGWWIGEGKCLHKNTETKYTVISNACELAEEIK